MNEQRAFTVVVTGCWNCHYSYDSDFSATGMNGWCGKYPRNQTHPKSLISDNYNTITPTCPMYKHSQIEGEEK
jgi:hypothetical protein